MPRVRANEVDISYEVDGSGPPLLLVMGLGGQLTDWHPGFVDRLLGHFTVIRFDNRDIGLSTYSEAPPPTRWDVIRAVVRPESVNPPYALTDMADDAHALLGALGIERAHVVGMSMGAMIAQLLTLARPAAVQSLCSIMSTTGDRRSGRPTLRVLASLARRGEPPRADAVRVTMELFHLIGGQDWDANEQRRRTTASIERAYNPAGILRQAFAVAASPDRTGDLGRIEVPTLVMHGLDDTLVRPSGGVATATAIPASRLLMFPRMGHDIPATRHDEMVDAIVTNTRRPSPSPAF